MTWVKFDLPNRPKNLENEKNSVKRQTWAGLFTIFNLFGPPKLLKLAALARFAGLLYSCSERSCVKWLVTDRDFRLVTDGGF